MISSINSSFKRQIPLPCIDDLINGIFVEECKNRFLCKVLINGIEELCYVASSAHLSSFLELNGKTVLLAENKGKNTRTHYTLIAVKIALGYVMLNLNLVNYCVAEALKHEGKRYSCPQREKKVASGYKCDLYYEGEAPTMVEAKAVLSEHKTVVFPSVHGFRVAEQLTSIKAALLAGYRVRYCLVILTPTVEHVELTDNSDFLSRFANCLNAGMCIDIYRIRVTQRRRFYIFHDELLEQELRDSLLGLVVDEHVE